MDSLDEFLIRTVDYLKNKGYEIKTCKISCTRSRKPQPRGNLDNVATKCSTAHFCSLRSGTIKSEAPICDGVRN